MAYDFDSMSNEELMRIANGGTHQAAMSPSRDFDNMSNEQLMAIASGKPLPTPQKDPQPTPKKPDDYGFTDRRHDEIVAQGGRDAYAGQEYIEGLAPFARSVRESGEREEDENQSAFLNGKALEDAIERHGDAPDESLKGYKAQQFGAVETGVRMAGHNLSKAAANLPLFIGEAVKGVRGLGRRAYNNKATDVLIDYARDAGFDDEEIERAKEHSQGDPYKMYDFFQDLAEATIEHHADQKAGAAQRLAEHADEEGLVSKIAGGALGMIPMMEEFAIGGGIVKGLGLAKGAANAATWQGRLAAGLQHSKFMTPLMGSEFARRRYGELTRDEYVRDEDGNLVVKKGDDKASALAKATAGGLGEAAIFSLPIGEAVMGWAPKVVTKALRTKVSPTVAKMYENYVKYGQLTGLRGQPVMLGLMDANTFKDEVLGLSKKDGDYEGFGKEWDKFWSETMSAKNQADLFVSTLGVMAVQGGVALAKARSAIAKENRSTDAVLKTYFEVPDELLRQMSPEHKSMWRKLIMQRSKGKGFALNEDNLRKFVNKMGDRYGEETKSLYDKMAKYALEKDNSRDWMKGVEASEETSFSVPKRRNAKTGNVEVAWDDDIEDVGGRTIRTQSFTDPKTGITVSKFLPTDAGLSDDGYVYVVRDKNGRQAARHGITDAIDAARDMERAGNTAVRQRQNKANYIKELYAKNFPGESPEILDTADQYQERYGRALLPGQIALNADGKQVYILDRIETPQMAMKTVLHEVGRHRGLDFAIPDANARAEFLRSLAASDDPVVQNQLARIAISQGFTSPEEALKDPYVVEEVYAHLFDHEGVPAEPGAWEKHGTAIRRTMRRFFKRLPFSRDEAEEVYRGAMDELSRQTGGAVSYIPEEAEAAPLTPRQEHEQRMERKAAGAKAVGEYRAEEAAARLEEEARKSAMDEAARKAEEERLAGRKSAVESAVAEAGEEIGAERERRAKEQAIGRKAQEEKARIKAEAEEYEAKERERIERERRAEQEAQEDAELERMIAEETRENERKALEDYRKSRREAIERRNKALAEAEAEQKRLDAERERIAQERARTAQEREEARKAGYESADEKARQERQRAISDAFHRDASIRGKEERDRLRREAAEFEAAEEMRKLQETAEEADIRAKMERGEYDPNAEPPVFVEDMPKGKTSLKRPGDVVRTVWQGKNKSNPIIVRAERDANGNLMGWNVLSAEQGKPERLIRSVPYARNSASSKKQTAGEAIKASANALKKFFGDPNKPVDELAKRVDEKIAPEQKLVQPETAENRGKTGAVDESAAQSGNLVQAETPRRELFDGRNRSDATAINDIVSSIDWTGERAERRANGDTEVKSVGDALDFLRNFDPNARFFDKSEELMDADRAESNRQFVNMIGALHDERRIRGFGDFARLVKSSNPELFKNRKGDLRAIWNYAAHISDGKIEPVGEYAARDAIRSADEGRNVRDVTNMNALRAALQEIDVEMYPARKINGGDARNPNIKLAADPKSGIIPGHELPGTPRSLLSKPILAIEYADGEMHVGTGRHRRDLYDRFDMDIPIRRLKETDGWVKKREDGTYDTSKIRLLDALDNIQDGKGSIEDYVSFFRDVQIPREEAEREGFLGSKEARVAYALANDASPDLRASVNFEGGKRKGFITPEQAGAIADIAPLRGWEHNDAVQRQLLKDVLADRTMDTTDIQIDAAEIAHDIRREIEAGKIVQGDLFGGALDAGADIREKKRDYIRSQIAEYERLAKDIRAAKNSDNGLTIKREDMRKLGINERNIAKGGVDMRREYEAAAQRAMMRAMEWRQMELKPEDRAQMERALGIETDARRQSDEAAYRDWLKTTGNPDSDASRHLFDDRMKKADFALDSISADELAEEQRRIAQQQEIARRREASVNGGSGGELWQNTELGSQGKGGQQELFFDRNEELDNKVGGVIEQLVKAKLTKDFASLAKFIHDRNPALFNTVSPVLGELWNERAKKLGVAQIPQKEYTDVITKLGGTVNGLGSRPNEQGPEVGAGRGRSGNGVLGGGLQQPGVQGTAGTVGKGDDGSATPSGKPEGRGVVAGADDGKGLPKADVRDGKQPSEVAKRADAADNGADVEQQYTPAKAKFDGAKKSATPMVEPRGLRGIEPPDVKYKIHIPQEYIESGALQEHQLEGVAYSGQIHEQFTPDGKRKAIIHAHGTGAGKTRIAAGVILDNWQQGRKKALWFSVNRELKKDAIGDLNPFGLGDKVYDVGDGSKIKDEGIAFGSYNDLKTEHCVDNLVKALGKDFDGVIAFDECHTGKTTYGLSLKTGKEEGFIQKAMVDLQERLPNARVIYLSATPATEVSDLGYATRLGLWGEGTKFKDFADFVKKVKNKNLLGMEAVSRSLKMRGQMLSCALSDKGVDFREIHTATTDEQKKAYRDYNRATRDIFSGILDAQEAMGDLGNRVPTSSLHGMQQRMHNSMLAAVKLPQIIEKAKQHLAAGECPVFSLFYTNEAGTDREVKKAAGRGENLAMDEANFGPKQILMDFLTNEKEKTGPGGLVYRDTQFPTKSVKQIQNPISGEIEFVVEESAAARSIRARLQEQVKKLPDSFGNPINMILDAFGKNNVANLTGLNKDGFDADYEAFKNGEKKVLVFSKKANTGFTFSSDKKFKNRDRRVFFKIQNEWRADDFEQAKGRVHRNNQESAPIFYTTTSDFPGEARFFSTIARRKGQLSALSQGDRAVGGEMIGERHNLEDDYSARAIQWTIQAIINGGHADDFARQMNLLSRSEDGTINKLLDKNGNAAKMKPGRFWNRIMLLDPGVQEQVFEVFDRCKKALIQNDIDEGKYDRGLQDSGATHADDLHTLPLADGMKIEHVNNFFKTDRVSFDDFQKRHEGADLRYVRSKRTGEIFAVEPDGKMSRGALGKVDAVARYSVDGKRERMYASRLETRNPRSFYEEVKPEDAKSIWDAEYGIIPEERAEDGFYANGDLLEHWDDIVGSSMPQSFAVKTGKREFIGTKVPLGRVADILRTYGKGEEAHGVIVDSVVRQVLNNKSVELTEDGLKMKGVPRDGGQSVMITGFADKEAAKKWAMDVKMQFLKDKLPEPDATPDKKRVFMKADAKTLRDLIDRKPVKLYDEAENPIGDTTRFFDVREESDDRFRDVVKRFGVTEDISDALLITPKGNVVPSRGGKIEHGMLFEKSDLIGKFSDADSKKASAMISKLPNIRDIAIENPMALEHGHKILATSLARGKGMTAKEAIEIARKEKGGIGIDSLVEKGGVRIASNHGGIQVGGKLSEEAASRLWDYIEWHEKSGPGDFKVDLIDYDADDIVSVGYTRRTSPSKVIADIREFYETGKRPEGTSGGVRDFFFNIDEEAGGRVHLKRHEDAVEMEKKGIDRREIWEKTGWWKAPDGKWRVEIQGITEADTKKMLDFALASGRFYDKDKDASMNQYAFTFDALERAMKEKGERLPDSVKTLLTAYPEIGRQRIVVDRMAEQPKDGTLGFASDKEIHLYERGTTAETLNHELQHRIQAAAGMARGTNTNGKSFDRYTHELGEWEARQAATRAAMTPEERAKTPPWETADRHGVAEDSTLIDDANRKRIRPDGEKAPPRQSLPATDAKQTIASKYHTNLTDRYHPILEMERADGRDKKTLYREDSPYNAMRLLHGHNEASRMRYEHQWRRPFEKMLRDSGVTVDDVGVYMICRNVEDRNRKVLARNGKLEGSGVSDADAKKMLTDLKARLGDEKFGKIEQMADFLWKMQAEGMDRRVESGRVDAKTVAEWRKEEPFHVPMRDDMSDDGEVNYSTRQWRQNDFKTAEGRVSVPDNPVEFMFKEYQEAMYGSNVNDARKTLAKYITAHPGLGVVRRGVRKGKGWSFTHGQMEEFPDPYYREQSVKGGPGKPNLVAFKDGGNLMMIELDGKLGERVAAAVTGRDVAQAPGLLRNGMRLYASTATEWSPTFIGRNFAADMVESALNTIADKGLIKGGYSAVKHVFDALAMTKTIYAYNKRGTFEGKYADIMRDYVESGASIGGAGNEGYSELEKRFEKVRSGKASVKDMFALVGNALSIYNKQAELATRLAVFKDYMEGGASKGEAAMRSREYTTDFNKYGNQRWMNSAWMFSGSVIGSAMRQVESLARGKSGKQLATALFAYGVAEALAEHFFNSEEDEKNRKEGKPTGDSMTEYARANSLYFRNGDKYIRIPFHAGPFSVIKYIGNTTARAALGDLSWGDWAKHSAKEAGDTAVHFAGTGDAGPNITQTFMPTLLVPFFQHADNADFAGRPIKKQMYSQTLPYSENGRASTGEGFKAAARWMNAQTGGSENRRGWLDVAPETLQHIWTSLGKNTARDIEGVYDFVTDAIGGDIKIEHVPFGRDYERSVPDNTQNFYKAEEAYKKDLADGSIASDAQFAKRVNALLTQIRNLRHWEAGERKVGQKWVAYRKPTDETRAKYEAMRLKAQQRVIELMAALRERRK